MVLIIIKRYIFASPIFSQFNKNAIENSKFIRESPVDIVYIFVVSFNQSEQLYEIV